MQSTSRVQKHRDAMRKAGMRPIQIWVPDTRRADFAEQCRREIQLIKNAGEDVAIQEFLDYTLNNIEGWE